MSMRISIVLRAVPGAVTSDLVRPQRSAYGGTPKPLNPDNIDIDVLYNQVMAAPTFPLR